MAFIELVTYRGGQGACPPLEIENKQKKKPFRFSAPPESCPGTYLGSCWDEVLARYLDLVGVVRTLLQIYNIEKG